MKSDRSSSGVDQNEKKRLINGGNRYSPLNIGGGTEDDDPGSFLNDDEGRPLIQIATAGERDENAVSTTWTLMNFLKGMIGPGCLALPVAFKECGLWAGLVLIFVVGILNAYCMRLLVTAAQYLCIKSGKLELDYGHLAKKAFDYGPERLRPYSKEILYATNTVICIMQLGIGSVLLVFMASHVEEVIESFTGSGTDLDTRVFMCIIILPLILLNYIRELRVLSWLSTLANLFMLLSFAVIFSSLIAKTTEPENKGGQLPAVEGFSTFLIGLGSMLYAFEGQAMVLPLENKMREPTTMLGWSGVLTTGMTIVTSIYAATGFFGYTSYGKEVMGSIAQNFPNTPLYLAVKVLLIISVYVGYGIQLYVVIEMLWPAILRKLPAILQPYSLLIEYGFRTVLVLITFLLAIAIPNLEDIIPLVGVSAGMILAFVVPPLLDMVTFWDNWTDPISYRPATFYAHVVSNVTLIVIGIFGLVAGLYVNIYKLVTVGI